MTGAEGDRVAAMVLALVTEIAKTRPRPHRAEPTSIYVDSDVRHVVSPRKRG